MNTKQKKALYESIMKSVAKTIKRALNENNSNPGKYVIYYEANGEDAVIEGKFINKQTALRKWIKGVAEFLSFGPDDTCSYYLEGPNGDIIAIEYGGEPEYDEITQNEDGSYMSSDEAFPILLNIMKEKYSDLKL